MLRRRVTWVRALIPPLTLRLPRPMDAARANLHPHLRRSVRLTALRGVDAGARRCDVKCMVPPSLVKENPWPSHSPKASKAFLPGHSMHCPVSFTACLNLLRGRHRARSLPTGRNRAGRDPVSDHALAARVEETLATHRGRHHAFPEFAVSRTCCCPSGMTGPGSIGPLLCIDGNAQT